MSWINGDRMVKQRDGPFTYLLEELINQSVSWSSYVVYRSTKL